MSQPLEKQSKHDPAVGEKDAGVHVGIEGQYQVDAEGPVYKDSKRTWKSFFWSTLDVPKEEARFLTKLDLTLISSSALGVMCRYLDQVNITNAFNSGMKEDLALYGKELNYANAIWSAAYVFGQVPSNLLLTRVNAPLYIAFLEFAWTVFTFATAGVKDVNQLYVFRFFVGLFEAGHFPAVMYVCSSYYKPHELARRNTLIQIFTSVGPLFSGFLMAAVHAGLDGASGLPGWRWMYIVCGCISLPCAVWTAFAMPQLPSRAKANWIFTEKEIELARARMPTETKPFTGLFKWKDIRRWHTTWHVYLLIFWVKSYNTPGKPAVFSVAEINIIPLGINIISIVCTLINSWVSDSLPGAARWPGMLFASVMAIIFPIALAATPVHPPNIATRWTLYYLTALSGTCAGLTWTWVNETNRHDPEKRAYVSALMNAFAYIFTAWVPIFTFPANLQPYIVTGNYITAGFGAAAAITVLVIRRFYNRDLQKKQILKV
ncbi:Major facilitator superfamily transporter [Colletotrichum higginsianum IMI 349063]|uniref:Major facilitator superfamily transporter n=1 Tax=Colletotrichum higginsianum (strain IMI 349063) TaxID=759273 RepID=A0A1B7YBN4_COLHI|nr:Major facilitator superfamily transporter [Colletotrichum higginsianum IMI 349063]OBR09523.1 Major facilitator superfamily transporter [Colletotrichum higginsianum IMI 349063]